MNSPEAIAEFREAAQAKGDFRPDSAEDHALHDRMAVAFRFLSEQGAEGRSTFAALLNDDSAHVRSWVSAQLLSEGDAQAIPIAEQLALAPVCWALLRTLHSRSFVQDDYGLRLPMASNQSMKPTARLRNEFSVFATTPWCGLSTSR